MHWSSTLIGLFIVCVFDLVVFFCLFVRCCVWASTCGMMVPRRRRARRPANHAPISGSPESPPSASILSFPWPFSSMFGYLDDTITTDDDDRDMVTTTDSTHAFVTSALMRGPMSPHVFYTAMSMEDVPKSGVPSSIHALIQRQKFSDIGAAATAADSASADTHTKDIVDRVSATSDTKDNNNNNHQHPHRDDDDDQHVNAPSSPHDTTIQCCVCLDYFAEMDDVYILPCKHILHVQCLTPWMKDHTSCPMRCGPIVAVDKVLDSMADPVFAHARSDMQKYIDAVLPEPTPTRPSNIPPLRTQVTRRHSDTSDDSTNSTTSSSSTSIDTLDQDTYDNEQPATSVEPSHNARAHRPSSALSTERQGHHSPSEQWLIDMFRAAEYREPLSISSLRPISLGATATAPAPSSVSLSSAPSSSNAQPVDTTPGEDWHPRHRVETQSLRRAIHLQRPPIKPSTLSHHMPHIDRYISQLYRCINFTCEEPSGNVMKVLGLQPQQGQQLDQTRPWIDAISAASFQQQHHAPRGISTLTIEDVD